MRMTPSTKIWIGLAIVTVIGIVCFAFLSAIRARSLASAYVREVRSLQVGKSGFQDFLAIRYMNASSMKWVSPTCGADICSAAFEFSNRWLAHLHLARPAYLYSRLTLFNGAVREIDIDGGCYGRNGGLFLVSVQESEPNPLGFSKPFESDGTQASGKRSTIGVRLTPEASAEQREKAYSLDFGFLNRLGACNDANDILPTVR